jgi:hypothetical protein
MHHENPLFKQLDSDEFVKSRQAQLQAKLKRNGRESLTQAQQEVEQALGDQARSFCRSAAERVSARIQAG